MRFLQMTAVILAATIIPHEALSQTAPKCNPERGYHSARIRCLNQITVFLKEKIDKLEGQLSQYAKASDLAGYAKSSDLAAYAKASDTHNLVKKSDLDGYAKSSDVRDLLKGADVKASDVGMYLTKSDLNDYLKASDARDFVKKSDLGDFAKASAMADFVTKSDLTDYVKYDAVLAIGSSADADRCLKDQTGDAAGTTDASCADWAKIPALQWKLLRKQ